MYQSDLKQLMIDEYYPREEIQKLEQELWNLMMKEADVFAYTNCFNDLLPYVPEWSLRMIKKTQSYI